MVDKGAAKTTFGTIGQYVGSNIPGKPKRYLLNTGGRPKLFEIIAPRFQSIPFDSPGSSLADCGVNGGIILGRQVTDWRSIDYPNPKTSLVIDGKTAAEGTGALVLGHPFKSLTWLVNSLGKRGFAVAKGQVLTTGSMTGIVYADQGSHAVGDFGRLGRVEARFV